MPDHADSLDDALNISLDRAGRVDLELIARLADTTVDEAEASLGDRIIRDPDTGDGHARRGLPHRRRGNETRPRHGHGRTPEAPRRHRSHDGIRGSHLRDAGGHARHGAGSANGSPPRERTCGAASRTRTAAESYRDPAPVIERINGRTTRMDHGLEPQPGTCPRPRLAGCGGTSREPHARHPRTIRHRRAETVARAGMAPITRHQPTVGRPVLDMARRRRAAGLRADPRRPAHARQGPRPVRPQDRPHRPDRNRRQDRDPLQPVRKLARRRCERPARLDGHDHRRDGTPAHARHRPTPHDSPNGSPPTCPSANGSGASPANCQTDCARRGSTTPTARRPASSTRAPTTTGSSERAARSSSDNGVSSRSTPRPRTPTRRTRNGSNTWPTCWNACSPPHWRPNRSRRRWEPRGSPPGTSTTS